MTPSPWAEQIAGRTAARARLRRRRIVRTIVLGVAALLVVTVGLGGYLYVHLNRNLRSVPLFAGTSGNAGTEAVDPFGRSPINILLIGSDSRNNAADCHLGGDCGPGANADVEMIVHVSADRTNATVTSIPRDLVTDLPSCRNPQGGAVTPAQTGQINSTLVHGPGCTVAAVHKLTQIPIDHFVMVDFSGVVKMSDAVGGVQVCVSNNVYDPYSHLKLSKGEHTLKGDAALAFVRSRHGFGDGSDLGRTYAQHAFLSAVIRRLKSTGVLTDPAALYSLADAATKALTVDTGLNSIPRLLGLASDLNKVPTSRITFTTMQTEADPANPNRVVLGPGARELFATIIDDQPLTAAHPSGTGGTPAATATPAPPSQIEVRVENATGLADRAATVAQALIADGFSRGTTFTTAPSPATATVLRFGPGQLAQARAVAAAVHLPAGAVQAGTGRLTLVIGSDWTSGARFPSTAGTASATNHAALSQAHAQTAAQSGACVPVSTQDTVVLNGVPMTPIRAFALSPGVPVSAP